MSSEFHQLYGRMFEANQKGDTQLADSLRRKLEQLRIKTFRKPSAEVISKVIDQLPVFASRVLGKDHLELGLSERSNCINAAFNFHDEIPLHGLGHCRESAA